MNGVNHRELNSMLICCHFKKSVLFQRHLAFCVMCDCSKRTWTIWSPSQPLCPGYPSSTSGPLGEWDRLPSEGPHQVADFHPPTTLTRGSSLTLPLNDTRSHRRSHLCHNRSSLTRETIQRYSLCAGLQHCHATELNQKPFDKIWT